MKGVAIAVAALAVALGIGIVVGGVLLGAFSSDSESRTGPIVTAPSGFVVAYFYENGHLVPLRRQVISVAGQDAIPALLNAVGAGLRPAERRAGFSTAAPGSFSYETGLKDGRIVMDGVDTSNNLWLGQLVFTLTRLPSIKSVTFGDRELKRSDFEGVMPPILVESPLLGDKVRSPLHVTGTANTFEATFQYDLRTRAGKLLAHHFVTATSGTGQRGTFAFDVRFHVVRPTRANLVVYELSAANGERINVRAIPLTLRP
jgi:Immunoglobulin-like domain of bacterial spore germination